MEFMEMKLHCVPIGYHLHDHSDHDLGIRPIAAPILPLSCTWRGMGSLSDLQKAFRKAK
jgi:hypothetical protein